MCLGEFVRAVKKAERREEIGVLWNSIIKFISEDRGRNYFVGSWKERRE